MPQKEASIISWETTPKGTTMLGRELSDIWETSDAPSSATARKIGPGGCLGPNRALTER